MKASLIKQEEIDDNYIRLIKRLLNAKMSLLLLHDDAIITHIKQFIKDNNIEKDNMNFKCYMVSAQN